MSTLAKLALTLILVAHPSCFTAKQEARLAEMERGLAQNRATIEELGGSVSTLISELENARRRADREKYCRDRKAGQITEFIDQVQAGLQDACTPISMSRSLSFLFGIPTAIAHLDPVAGIVSLRQTRIGQIRDVLEPSKLHTSTRLLVMVKPAEDNEAGRHRAKAIASQLIDEYVRPELPATGSPSAKEPTAKPGQTTILGPHLLPCELSHNMGELYKKSFYKPLPSEPQIGKPDVLVFLIVSDC